MLSELPIIETKRLMLRKLTLTDASDIFEYASDEEVAKYCRWNAHKTIDDSVGFIKYLEDNFNKYKIFDFGIIHKESQKVIGTCGFVNWKQSDNNAEIGYALSRQFWNQGFMTEAVTCLIQFGFKHLGIHRIEALCDPNNTGSQHVLTKADFQYGWLAQK